MNSRRFGRGSWKVSHCYVIRLLVFGLFSSLAAVGQTSSSKDCLPILTAQDYFSYQQKANLHDDYLRSIDEETYKQLKTDNKLGFLGLTDSGAFKLNDDYASFNEIRNKYLETVHYQRTQEQALNILQITTNPRAYPAYEKCLENLGGAGNPLRVYASDEDTNRIVLHVKYVNPTGKKKVRLEGSVIGGHVRKTPAGHLWPDKGQWGVNEIRTITIDRDHNSPETVVSVQPTDHSSDGVTLHFKRADATLELKFVGAIDVLRVTDKHHEEVTPNNGYNMGHCPNEVGRGSVGECISRTYVKMTTSDPFFFKNARTDCWKIGASDGCTGHTNPGKASISADGLTAETTLDNGSIPVNAVLLVDEYEHLSEKQCRNDGPLPVIRGQVIIFGVRKECLPIATIQYHSIESDSHGAIKFGESSPGLGVTKDSELVSGDIIIATYKLDR
jgi:hypothetical protein